MKGLCYMSAAEWLYASATVSGEDALDFTVSERDALERCVDRWPSLLPGKCQPLLGCGVPPWPTLVAEMRQLHQHAASSVIKPIGNAYRLSSAGRQAPRAAAVQYTPC